LTGIVFWPIALNLETAREIRTKVSGIELSEADEMIRSRFGAEDKAPKRVGYGLRSSGLKDGSLMRLI